jgi:hypothetical protein
MKNGEGLLYDKKDHPGRAAPHEQQRRSHFTGCGGDLDEWVTGINELFTKKISCWTGDTFQNVSVFEHDGHTNLLFNG